MSTPIVKVNAKEASIDLEQSLRSPEVEYRDMGPYCVSLREDGSLVIYYTHGFCAVIRQWTQL